MKTLTLILALLAATPASAATFYTANGHLVTCFESGGRWMTCLYLGGPGDITKCRRLASSTRMVACL